jgi:formylglycine-generating enzyme required for sulfatase activity
MGSSNDETGRTAGESHQHEIAITNAFVISKSEIRFEQWDACVAAAECPLAFDAWGMPDDQRKPGPCQVRYRY